jgi:hypothetical protein
MNITMLFRGAGVGASARGAAAASVVMMWLVVMPSPVHAIDDYYSQASLSKLSTESLIAHMKRFADDIAKWGPRNGGPEVLSEHWDREYVRWRIDMMRRIRSVLSARGIQPPDVPIPPPTPPAGGGGSPGAGGSGGASGGAGGSGPTGRSGTQLTRPPPPRGATTTTPQAGSGGGGRTPTSGGTPPTSYLAPLLIVLTAAELLKCQTDGVDLATCAENLAVKFVVGSAITGVTVAVIGTSGMTILTGVAVAASAGSLVVTGVELGTEVAGAAGALATEAGANLNRDAQLRANAERVTAAGMDTLVAAFEDRVRSAWLDEGSRVALDSDVNALAAIVTRARTELDAFRRLNLLGTLATRSCRERGRNPLVYAADAERRVADMQRLSALVTKGVADASALVTPCAGADAGRRATEAYAEAKRNLQRLEQTGRDARADIEDVAKFFTTLKAARQAQPEVARALATLEATVAEARRARTRLVEGIASYAARLEAFRHETAGLHVSYTNLKNSFPADPPPHIYAGLVRLDAVLNQSIASVLTEERLDAIALAAADEASRVEGLHRTAVEELADLGECGGITDELPEPLKNLLVRLDREITSHYQTAEKAVTAGDEIPTKAAGCGEVMTAAATDGRLTGRCQGAIEVMPASGRPGRPLSVRVTIDPPGSKTITRVVAANPGCTTAACREMRLMDLGEYSLILTLQAPANARPVDGTLGAFHLDVSAFEGEQVACSGRSKAIRVVAP